jgi:transposase
MKAYHEVKQTLPEAADYALGTLVDQFDSLNMQVDQTEARILTWHRQSDVSRRRATIPGIGPITASAIAAGVPDASLFQSGRQFAAWLGLTPRAHSSGGKERQRGISKQGDGYIRRLLVVGATAVIRFARPENPGRRWASGPAQSRFEVYVGELGRCAGVVS